MDYRGRETVFEDGEVGLGFGSGWVHDYKRRRIGDGARSSSTTKASTSDLYWHYLMVLVYQKC